VPVKADGRVARVAAAAPEEDGAMWGSDPGVEKAGKGWLNWEFSCSRQWLMDVDMLILRIFINLYSSQKNEGILQYIWDAFVWAQSLLK